MTLMFQLETAASSFLDNYFCLKVIEATNTYFDS